MHFTCISVSKIIVEHFVAHAGFVTVSGKVQFCKDEDHIIIVVTVCALRSGSDTMALTTYIVLEECNIAVYYCYHLYD